MTKLILLRHAEASGNSDRIFHGQTNSTLTKKGEQQLSKLKERFLSQDYDAIYSSDLDRAYNTALTVNHKSLDISKSVRLREIFGGDWENMPFADIPKKFPIEFNIWDKSMHLLKMPSGESFADFSSRILLEINSIAEKNQGKTVVIATHGTVIKVYLCYSLGLPFSELHRIEWSDNTGVTELEYFSEDNIKVLLQGDSSHLPDELATIKHQDWHKRKNSGEKVITVTLNPCIDKTIFLDEFKIGGLNRINKSNIYYAGKGINVSCTLSNLNVSSIATGFLATNEKAQYENIFSSYNIQNEFVMVTSSTRINTKILSNGIQTELNEAGFWVGDNEKEALFNKLSSLCDNESVVIISGSSPQNFTISDFKKLCDIVINRGARLVVDCEREQLLYAVENNAFLIKPNLFEMQQLLGKEITDIEQLKLEAMAIVKNGVKNVIITLGEDGALFTNIDNLIYKPGRALNVKGVSGAGDSILSGFIAGFVNNKTFTECVNLSFASACAKVETDGTKPPDLIKIKDFLES